MYSHTVVFTLQDIYFESAGSKMGIMLRKCPQHHNFVLFNSSLWLQLLFNLAKEMDCKKTVSLDSRIRCTII